MFLLRIKNQRRKHEDAANLKETCNMNSTVRRIFDFQRFSPNAELEALIKETEGRYAALDDSDLELVNAAGEVETIFDKKDDEQ